MKQVPLALFVSGLPGVGKSTVSEEIAARTDACLLRSDVIRKELFGQPNYSSEETHLVYQALAERTSHCLRNKKSVVVDATFRERARLESMMLRAETNGARVSVLLVEAREDIALNRISARTDDVSDATMEVYHTMTEKFESPPRIDFVIENSGSVDNLHERISDILISCRISDSIS